MAEKKQEAESGPSFLVCMAVASVFQYIRTHPQKVVSRVSSSIHRVQPARLSSPAVVPHVVRGLQRVMSGSKSSEQSPAAQAAALADASSAREYSSALAEVKQAGGLVGVQWALGAVKNQKREGACTAFAVSSALEALLFSRFQIRARVDEKRFWKSYAKSSLQAALSVSQRESKPIFAEVLEESEFHSFPKGAQLKFEIPADGVEAISLAEVPQALRNHYPVVLATVFKDTLLDGFSQWRRFIPAHRGLRHVAHAVALSGMRYNMFRQGELLLQFRNSWGENWGSGGDGNLDARHCIINHCEMYVIKNISLVEEPASAVTKEENVE
ncbi:MAG: Papain family cysteine protease [Pseudomonadota bacterium]